MLLLRIMNFHRSENGATAIEYGLIVALLALGCIFGLTTLGTTIRDFFSSIGPYITS